MTAPAISDVAALPLESDDRTRRLLDRMGRTEGLAFDRDGRRLAIVGFGGKVLLAAVGCRTDERGHPVAVALTCGELLWIPGGLATHGVAFVDDDLLVVADREGPLSVVSIGSASVAPGASMPEEREVAMLLDIRAASPLHCPHVGSVAVVPIDERLFDVIACDGNLHRVTRHLLERTADGIRLVDSELLIADGLDLPDGASVSPDGQWLAVSNHERRMVTVHPLHEPGSAGVGAGHLEGITYPHGVAFAAAGAAVLVTDAGAPTVHVFRSAARGDHGDDVPWSGRRAADAVVRVMDDATFARGNSDQRNGGPKGIAAHDGVGLVAITCANLHLAVFAVDSFVGPSSGRSTGVDDRAHAARGDAVDLSDRLLRRLREQSASGAADREAFGPDRHRLHRAMRLVRLLEWSPLWRLLVWLRYGRRLRRAERVRQTVYAARRAEELPD